MQYCSSKNSNRYPLCHIGRKTWTVRPPLWFVMQWFMFQIYVEGIGSIMILPLQPVECWTLLFDLLLLQVHNSVKSRNPVWFVKMLNTAWKMSHWTNTSLNFFQPFFFENWPVWMWKFQDLGGGAAAKIQDLGGGGGGKQPVAWPGGGGGGDQKGRGSGGGGEGGGVGVGAEIKKKKKRAI